VPRNSRTGDRDDRPRRVPGQGQRQWDQALDQRPLLADSGIDIGDWVLVHVGFAMAKIDEREATATLDAVRRMGKAYTDELDAFRSTGTG
jgi:hypothetical protein